MIPGLIEPSGASQLPQETDDLLQSQVREPAPNNIAVENHETASPDNAQPDGSTLGAPEQDPGSDVSLYDVFLLKLRVECAEDALNADDIAERLDLQKSQVSVWLKKAVEEKKLRKLTRPVRYEWPSEDAQQSMFDD